MSTTPNSQRRVLVAGATGYVGKHVLEALKQRGYTPVALVRDAARATGPAFDGCIIVTGNVLEPATLQPACAGAIGVISCLASRSEPGAPPSHAYRPLAEGTLNLFRAAEAAGVARLVIVSSCNSREHRDEYAGFAARETAMDEIRALEARSGCTTGVTVIAGSMFFKDTDRVLKTMRRRGTAAAFGDGFSRRYNPIHGADLAARLVDSLERPEEGRMIPVGGPDVLTYRQIAVLAAGAAGVDRPRYRVVPLWVLSAAAAVFGILSRVWEGAARLRAFAQFLLVVSRYDAVGECCGTRRLADYFREQIAKSDGGSETAGTDAGRAGNGDGTFVDKKEP